MAEEVATLLATLRTAGVAAADTGVPQAVPIATVTLVAVAAAVLVATLGQLLHAVLSGGRGEWLVARGPLAIAQLPCVWRKQAAACRLARMRTERPRCNAACWPLLCACAPVLPPPPPCSLSSWP